jgi:hypothetical protein
MNSEALIETIRAAVADGASDDARAAGANACRTLLVVLEAKPGEPLVPAIPVAQPPSAPIAVIASAIRGMPREQLFDVLIAKLRTLAPADSVVSEPMRMLNIPHVKVPTP